MNYRKIQKDNYNLHLIKTDKFKTVNIRINFKRLLKKEEITYRNFLNELLINSSKKYPTSRDIEIETEELYDLGVRTSSYNSGNYAIMSFSSIFLNEKYTEENMNKKSLEFLMELIFNPNIKDNKFDLKYFNIIKTSISDEIKSIKDNPSKYSVVRLYEEMDKGPLSYRTSGYLEDLDNITNENLYEYYKSVTENDNIDIFIIGDIKDDFEEILDKYIPNTKRELNRTSHFLKLDKEKEKVLKEKTNTNQSNLAIGLKLFDLTEFEMKYALNIYNSILGGGTDSKLFKVVREENSLCYFISSTPSVISQIITIVSGINGKDYDQTVKLVKEQLDKMKNGDFKQEDIDKAITLYTNGCMETYDSPSSIISNYISHEYAGLDLIEDRIKNIKKVTKKDIISLANKTYIDTIFLLEGEGTDEENTNI